ncbi:uncharacterized protein LOC126838682 [Adelges cooleyi]|uniref:uncharacterized protein LOC126838682 n=1 Tax=Adelges cooleyi TaxID=133065 RepID=UPI00217F9B6F|nr:uncharacterized protein LOC126838682 [Adelges cooleyi]XP_050429269.1 uncharacterized protein LOC126838682 [Adelges cooleyi]
MHRFQRDLSAIVLDEIALEGLDGITIEALCTRLSVRPDWPIKLIDGSVKTIIWSIIVCLKDVEFYRLQNPREPLVIFNRYEYIHSKFGSIYEPKNMPKDIYPNHCIEDGPIMGSCKDYYTRFNLGTFPRKITVEEAEKRWSRCLVIVASQETRKKALIPEEKQFSLNLPVRTYLVLERIGRSRYLGEASHGSHSLRNVFPDSKALSYIRNRLTLDGLIKNQIISYAGNSSQMSNRVVVSSLVRFFIKQQSIIDVMVSKIVDYLKKQPNQIATYDQVKTACSVSLAKTFKQPQLKKLCDTNLILKYRELFPNATINEYLSKKEPRTEKVLRCIQLKCNNKPDNLNSEPETVVTSKDREFKLDCSFERQILRWIENQSDGATLSEISRKFRFTSDGNLNNILKHHIKLGNLSKNHCDRGRSKAHVYYAKNHYPTPNIKCENVDQQNVLTYKDELELQEHTFETGAQFDGTVLNTAGVSLDNNINNTENNIDLQENSQKDNSNIDNTGKKLDSTISNSPSISSNTSPPNVLIINDGCKNNAEQTTTRTMEYGYCQKLFETSKQSVSMTDRFFFRQRIIFNLLSKDNIISLINLKKTIISTEKENPKFIGTLDVKTLIKIVGYFETKGRLQSVLYKVSYGTKTINQTFVATPSVNFCQPDIISYMNSFLNRFNNTLKTTKANKKWNLTVHKSPEPKIDIFSLKLPRFMKMRSLHEYLFYIVYDHPNKSLVNSCEETEKTVSSYRKDLVRGEEAQIPKVYNPTIGWKMFVPPLPKYPKYPEGWFFVSDIIHHMPLDLMLKIVNFNKSKINLEKLAIYATHPIYKYLPLMTLSSEVRSMLSQGLKKHIRNTLNVLRLLCTIGLVQFGPKTYRDTELIYAYLNRRACLLNTVQSSPSYYQVSDMEYERRSYEFFSSYEIENYWLDTWYFCTNTPLGYRISNISNKLKRREMLQRTKDVIEECCASRSTLEAVSQDNGTIPGDNKGAAGFDSHLYSHLTRNWNMKKKILAPKKKTKLNILLLQRMQKHRKKKETKKAEITSNKLYQMRYKWTPGEDNVLLFWKIGTFLIKQVKSHAFLSYGIKDIVKTVFGKFYRMKSVDNYLRRIRYLMRNSLIESKVNNLYENLKNDEEIQELFKNDIQMQYELHKAKKFKAMRELMVTDIKKLVLLLQERGIVIETRSLLQHKIEQPIDKPNDEKLDNLMSDMEFDNTSKSFVDLQNISQEIDYNFSLREIQLSLVNSLIHSSLSNQSSDPRISLSYLQAFKQYPDEILKHAFDIIKEENLITCSQYHKESLQVLLSTSHIIQSKTYDYSTKFSNTIVGKVDVNRYKEAYLTYGEIKDDLSERKMLLLYPSCGLCTLFTSLCTSGVIELSIEFDKKYLEYMPDEEVLNTGSNCLKNTLKRMRSRHFDLLSTSNESVEYLKIITSVTKQLNNYQVICKLIKSIPNIEAEINSILEELIRCPTFNPNIQVLNNLNNLSERLLSFCKAKELNGATQKDIKEFFSNIPLDVLMKTLKDLMSHNLVLRAGIEFPMYVHYKFANMWLAKIPSANWSCNEETEKNQMNEENKDGLSDISIGSPPAKKLRGELLVEKKSEDFDLINIRPWTRLDLTVNKQVMEYYLNSVLSKIIMKPGIYLKNLKKEYLSVIPPVYIRELVEMLETMKCVKMIHIKNIQKQSIYSKSWPVYNNLELCNVVGLEDESSIMLEPTEDCEFRFGYCSNKFQ